MKRQSQGNVVRSGAMNCLERARAVTRGLYGTDRINQSKQTNDFRTPTSKYRKALGRKHIHFFLCFRKKLPNSSNQFVISPRRCLPNDSSMIMPTECFPNPAPHRHYSPLHPLLLSIILSSTFSLCSRFFKCTSKLLTPISGPGVYILPGQSKHLMRG